ncbi:MAG: cytochrome c family protein [Planctomycetota bacterium]
MNRRLLIPLALAAVALVAFVFARAETPAMAADTPTYISQRSCKKCHFKQAKSWKKTVHKSAMDLLKPGERADVKKKFKLDPEKDYTKDPKCLACHTTGYGKPGGYPAYKETWSEDEAKLAKNNAGVGCEACHGPGSLYTPYKKDHEDFKRADVVKLGLVSPVTKEMCLECHNKENPVSGDGYTFDFEKRKADPKGIHEHTPLKNEH